MLICLLVSDFTDKPFTYLFIFSYKTDATFFMKIAVASMVSCVTHNIAPSKPLPMIDITNNSFRDLVKSLLILCHTTNIVQLILSSSLEFKQIFSFVRCFFLSLSYLVPDWCFKIVKFRSEALTIFVCIFQR